jgi:hypothetical protein
VQASCVGGRQGEVSRDELGFSGFKICGSAAEDVKAWVKKRWNDAKLKVWEVYEGQGTRCLVSSHS